MGRWITRSNYFAPILFGMLVVGRVGAQAPDAYLPNYNQGYGTGYTSGYSAGYTTGSTRGTKEGTSKGSSDGFRVGWDASYQPAFDAAYQSNLPIGHDVGYGAGASAGFESGFEWETTVYGSVVSSGNLTITLNNYSGDYSGGVILIAGAFNNGGHLIFSTNGSSGAFTMSGGGSYDWGAHYYQLGYDDGHAEGLTTGDTAGYDFAYPTAYATAYDTGVQTGTLQGTTAGSSEGATQGYTAGWSSGYGEGYDGGYAKAIYYYLTGGTLSSHANIAGSSIESANVPEPASLGLLAIAGMAFLRRGSRR